MPTTATRLNLKNVSQMAFVTLVTRSYKVMPEERLVEVTDDQKRELSDDIVGGISRCELKYAGSTYIGTVWQDKHDPKKVYARINQIHNSAGKHFPGVGGTLHDVPEDLAAARNLLTSN